MDTAKHEAGAEVDLLVYVERNEPVPHGHAYRVPIDDEKVRIDTPTPTGEQVLAKVGKRPCAYELIAEFAHHQNQVIEPHEVIDLRERGFKGFITAHKEIVTIFIGGPEKPYPIERGERTVTAILGKVGLTADTHMLLEEKPGQPPLPLPADKPVHIHGCELFHVQVNTGGSSGEDH